MPRICYVSKNFRSAALQLIEQANEIIEEYQADGLQLTLRQLYYQFISKDLLPNCEESYDKLGSVVSDARLAGLIDWEAIEDRARNLSAPSTWDSTEDIIQSALAAFALDRWKGQSKYVEVWVEKQALEAVIAQACDPYQVPYLACKGYMSQSEMWRASVRFREHEEDERDGVIIHLGDHDPSGIDMTRDIVDRMRVFDCSVEVIRIALNMDQVRKHNPPPNPAKVSDSRARSYIDRFGRESWELDALNPKTLRKLIQAEIESCLDMELYNDRVTEEAEQRRALEACADRWDDVVEFLTTTGTPPPKPKKGRKS